MRVLKSAARGSARLLSLTLLVLLPSHARAQSAAPPPPSPAAPATLPPPLAPTPVLDNRANAPAPATPGAASPPPTATTAPTFESAPLAAPAPVYDEAAVRRRLGGPFRRGGVRFGLVLGVGWTVSDTRFILGTGLGYFVADGLELGVGYEAWLLEKPLLNNLSPEIRYVFYMLPIVKPYVGFFYRHTFIKRHDDLDYLGGRAGLVFTPDRIGAYVGAGAVYEHMLRCESSDLIHCAEWYPEVTLGVSF